MYNLLKCLNIKFNFKKNKLFQDCMDEGMISLQRAREKITLIVNGYFDSLEKKY